MAPRFSVLLPTRNRSDVLPFAIESVLAQSWPDFELLIVGDGCTDDTASVVASFADPRIRWFDLPKAPGFGYANRNIALREGVGDLVAFMAHDDLLLPDHLAVMASAFESSHVTWAYSRPLWVSDDGYVVPFAVDLREREDLDTFTTHHNSIPASAVVYRRSLHERVGLWPEDQVSSGDWQMWKRMVGTDDANIEYVPTPSTLHFRAEWRDDSAWGPPPLHEWLGIARESRWPDALHIQVDGGRAPQQVFAELLRADGVAWTDALRAEVPQALERVAWVVATRAQAAADMAADGLATTRAHVAELETAVGAVEAERDAALARLASAQTELARVQGALAEAESRVAAGEARPFAYEARIPRSRIPVVAHRALRRVRLTLLGNPLFDAAWYRGHYPDLRATDQGRHWRTTGHIEQRNPNAWFDTAGYLAANPDVAASGTNPLDHYYVFGALEGRSPAPATAKNT